MALIKLHTNPSRRELKQFAGIWFPAFWALVGWLVWRATGNLVLATSLWVVAGVVSVVGFLAPRFMRPIFVGWMMAAYPVGWVISHLLLVAIFYLVLTPIGLVMRLLGRDPLQRKLDRQATSYWQPHEQTTDISRYFRQY